MDILPQYSSRQKGFGEGWTLREFYPIMEEEQLVSSCRRAEYASFTYFFVFSDIIESGPILQ